MATDSNPEKIAILGKNFLGRLKGPYEEHVSKQGVKVLMKKLIDKKIKYYWFIKNVVNFRNRYVSVLY